MWGSAVSPQLSLAPLCRHEGARVRVRAAAPVPPSPGEVPSPPTPEVPGQVPRHTGAHLWHLLGAAGPLCARGVLPPGFPALSSVPQEGNDKASAPRLSSPVLGAGTGCSQGWQLLQKNAESEPMARLKPCSGLCSRAEQRLAGCISPEMPCLASLQGSQFSFCLFMEQTEPGQPGFPPLTALWFRTVSDFICAVLLER